MWMYSLSLSHYYKREKAFSLLKKEHKVIGYTCCLCNAQQLVGSATDIYTRIKLHLFLKASVDIYSV